MRYIYNGLFFKHINSDNSRLNSWPSSTLGIMSGGGGETTRS